MVNNLLCNSLRCSNVSLLRWTLSLAIFTLFSNFSLSMWILSTDDSFDIDFCSCLKRFDKFERLYKEDVIDFV